MTTRLWHVIKLDKKEKRCTVLMCTRDKHKAVRLCMAHKASSLLDENALSYLLLHPDLFFDWSVSRILP